MAFLTAARNAQWKDANALLTATLKTCPESARVHYGMGRVYAEKGNYDAAIAEFKIALNIDPSYHEAINDIGLAEQRQGKMDEAIAQYRKTLQVKVDYGQAMYNLGTAYLAKGDYVEAIKILEDVSHREPANLQARNNLAVAYAQSGRLDDAVAALKDLLREDPTDAKALKNLKLFTEDLAARRASRPGVLDALKEQFPSLGAKWSVIAERRYDERNGRIEPPQRGPLGLRAAFPRRFGRPYSLSFNGASLDVQPLFARDGGARRSPKPVEARVEQGLIFYPEPYADTMNLYTASQEDVESLYYLTSDRAPRTFAYRLTPKAGIARFQLDGAGALQALDDQDRTVFALSKPLAMDSSGKTREGRYALDSNPWTLAISFDLDGLKFPILIDPTWTTGGAGTLNTARQNHTATLLPTGKVLVAGGLDATGHALNAAELYDPVAGTWSTTASMATNRAYHTATLLQSGKVLVVGGLDNNGNVLGTAELYDPIAGTWSSTANLPSNLAFRYHTATLLSGGNVLIVGGQDQNNVSLSSASIYNAAAGTWSTTASLNTNRGYHAATLLSNGKVLVVGGTNGGGTLSSAELYDPTAGTWTTTGSLLTARSSLATVLLPSGQVLALEGGIATAELYDPAAGTWSATGSLLSTTANAPATLLPNGQVLVAGGSFGGSVSSVAEVYISTAGTWTAVGSMTTSRAAHTATLLPNGKALIAGGTDATGAYLASAEVYDPSAGSWSATGNAVYSRYGQTATLLSNGTVLAFNGVNPRWDIYDPTAGTWSNPGITSPATQRWHTATLLATGNVLLAGGSTTNLPASTVQIYYSTGNTVSLASSMNVPRCIQTATRLPNGTVLVAAGSNGGGTNPCGQARGGINSAEIYDPNTGAWTTTSNLNNPHAYPTATLLFNGKVLVAGGTGGSNVAYAYAEIYDPVTATWSTTGSMTTTRWSHQAVLLPNGKVLVAGGSALTYNNTALSTAELYDPATGTWSATGSMSTPRGQFAMTLLPNGKVLAAGGASNNFYTGGLSSAEIYDPATGVWTTVSSLNTARYLHVGVLLANQQTLENQGNSTSNSSLATNELASYTEYGYASVSPSIVPVINTVAGSTSAVAVTTGSWVTVTGSSFTGVSEGSGANPGQSSPANQPRAYIRSMDSSGVTGQSNTWLIDVSTSIYVHAYSSTTLQFLVPPYLIPGYYTFWVESDGVPSTAAVINIAQPPSPPPAAPTGLTLSNVYSSSVTASWTASAWGAATSYLLQASTASNFTGAIFSSSTANTSATIAGLSAGTSYYFEVDAVNSNGNGAFTNAISTFMPTSPPGNPAVAAVYASSVAVTWTAASGATGYELDASTASNFSGAIFSSTTNNGSATTLTALSLSANTTYYLRAGALYNGTTNYAVALTTQTLPLAPTLISPINGAFVSTTTPALTWSTTTAWSELQLASDSGFTQIIADSTTANIYYVSTGVLSNGTLYYWRVGAAGTGVWSSTAAFEVDVVPPSLSSPQISTSATGQWTSLPNSSTYLSSNVVTFQATVQDAAAGLLVSTGLPAGIVAQWHLDESSGATVLDASTNSFNGVVVGGATRAAGKIGGGLSLNGNNQYVSLPLMDIDYSQGFSAEAWVYYNSFPGTAHILDLANGQANDNIVLENSGTSPTLVFQVYSGAGGGTQVSAANALSLGKWIHVAVTEDANANATLYIDGVAVANGNATYVPRSINRSNNYLGKSNWADSYLNGALDEVRLFNIALSSAQVLADYQSDTLNAHNRGRAFNVMYSTDAGATWAFVSTNSVTLTGSNGAASAQTLTASNIPLVNSTGPSASNDQIAFAVSDYAGNVSTAVYAVLIDTSGAAPTLIAPAGGAFVSTTTPVLEWSTTSASSELQIAADSGFTQIVADTTTTNAFYASTNALTTGTTYYWRARPAGGPLWSSASSFIVDAVAPVVSAPQVQINGGSSWTSLPNSSTYLSSNVVTFQATVQDATAGLLVSTGLPAGLITQWHLDESSGAFALDASGSADIGVAVGSPSWVAGRKGGALSFNGSSQYLYSSAQYSNPQVFSLESWFKTTTNSGGVIISFVGAGVDRSVYMDNSGHLYFGIYPGFVVTIQSPAAYNDGKWHHVAATLSSAGMALYVDGLLVATKTNSVASNYTGGWQIGYANVGGWTNAPSSNHLNGAIDEVRVYNVALSSTQILSDYQDDTLAAQNAGAAYSVLYSTNAGSTWNFVSTNSVTLTGANGTASAQTLTASGIPLITSTGTGAATDQVAFAVSDYAGNVSTSVYTILIDTNTPPTPVSPANGAFISTSNPLITWSTTTAGSSEVQLSQNSAFTQVIADSTTANAYYVSTNVLSNAVTYYWRVKAAVDPSANWSTTESLTVDLASPVFSGPQVSTAAGGSFSNITTAYLSTGTNFAWVTASVQDATSGLALSTTVASGAVGVWNFNEGSGSTAYDASSNGNNGTLINGPTWVSGQRGPHALSFNGSSQYVSLTNNVNLFSTMTALTIEAWVNPSSLSQASLGGGIGGTILDGNHDGNADGYVLGIRNTNKIWWWPLGGQDKFSTGSVPLNQWTHVALTWDGANVRMYINGQLDSTQSDVAPNVPTFLNIGDQSHITGYWNGSLDEIRLYSRALSTAEIERDYTDQAYLILYTTNTGATWSYLPASSTTLTGAAGSTSAQTVEASSVPVTISASSVAATNQVAFIVSDYVGNVSSAVYTIAVTTTANLPSNTAFSSVGASAITFTWSANGNPAPTGTLYTVLTSTAPNPSSPGGAVVTTSSTYNTSLSTAGLAVNASYYFQVQALVGNGIASAYTTAIGTSTLGLIPTPTWPISGNYVSTTTPVMMWSTVTATSELQLASDAAFTQVIADSTTANAYYVSTNVLTNGATYYWRVAGVGMGLWSSTASFIIDATPPVIATPQIQNNGGSSWTSLPNSSKYLSSNVVTFQATVQDATAGLLVSTGLPAGLVGQWHLDEGAGGYALDSSINSLTGTLRNSPSWVSGKRGEALQFDGSSSYVSLGDSSNLQLNTGFLSAWINTANAGTSFRGIFVKQSAYGLFLKSNVLETYDWSVSQDRSTGINLADGSWHQVAMSFQSGVTNGTVIYVDGVPRLTTTITVLNQTTEAEVGAGGGGAQVFNGTIDEARLFNTVPSSASVLAMYQSDTLAAHDAGNAFNVMYSTNAGTTWTFVSTNSVTLTGSNTTTAAQTLTASGIPLVTSTGPGAATDQIAFAVSDYAGNVSTTVYTILIDTIPTPTPTGPAGGSDVSTTTPILLWSTGTSSAELQIATDSGLTQIIADSTTANSYYVSTNVLANGTTYYWRVRGAGAPVWSPTISFVVDATPPAISAPQISTSATGPWTGLPNASVYLSSNVVTFKATVQDAAAGLMVSTGLPAGLGGLWHFDESSGSVALDASGSNNSATLYNNPAWVAGKRNDALQFDGSSSYAQANGISGKRSVSVWVKTGYTGQQQIFDMGSAGPATGVAYQLALTATNGLGGSPPVNTPGVYFTFWGDDVYIPNKNLADNAWHHIEMSWDGGTTVWLGVDGTFSNGYLWNGSWSSIKTQPFTLPSTPNPSNQPILIGKARSLLSSNGSVYFNGAIDELRVYTVARSSAQIVADYESDQLAAYNGGQAFNVFYSTNAGATWTFVSTNSVTLTGSNTTTAAQTLTASDIPLITSTGSGAPTDQIALTVSDYAGNVSTSVYTVLVATAVSVPANPSFSGVGSAAITFSWSANGNLGTTLYSVLTSTAPNPGAPGGAVVTTSNTYNTSLSTAGLAVNTTYYFQVQATNTGSNVSSAFTTAVGTSTLANLPGSVSYSNDTSSLISLSWSANGNPAGTLYTVFVASSPDIVVTAPGVVASSSNTYNTSLSTAGLTANSTYYFRVMATNNNGISTSYVPAPALATLAVLPSGITFSGLSSSGMTVSWSANGNPSGSTLYSVLASTAPDPSAPNGAVVTTSNTYNTSLSTSGLSANVTYYFQVEAINVANTPTGFTVAIGTSTLPNAPSGASLSAIDSGAITFSWSANGNPAGTLYSVLTSTASNPSAPGGAVVTTSNTYNTALSTSGLVANTTYFFQVQAINGDNVASAFTTVVGTSTLAIMPAGSGYSGVTASAITVSWLASGNPSGTLYTVLTSTAPNPTSSNGAVVTTSDTYNTSLSTGGLAANTTYYFAWKATNNNNIPTNYFILFGTTTLSNSPTGTAFSGVGPAALTFSWSSNGNPAGTLYSVLTSTASNPSAPGGAVVTTSDTYNTSLSTSGLSANTTYFFQVQAINGDNIASSFTGVIGTSTLANLPGSVSYNNDTSSLIALSWSANGNPAGTLYTVFVASSPDIVVTAPGVVASSSNTYNTSLSTAGLTANSTYYFRVMATNNNGVSTSYVPAPALATLAVLPSGITFGGLSSSGMTVSWSANGNPSGSTLYSVLTSTAPDPSAPNGAVVTTSNTYNTSLSTSGLSANVTYYFQVEAISIANTPTGFTTATGTSTLSNAPSGTSFSGIDSGAIIFSWSANGNAAGTLYSVLTSTASNPSAPGGAVVTTSNTYNTSLSTSGLVANTTYFFQVQAINGDNVASAFTAVAGTATLAAIPNSFVFSGVGASGVTISWSANGNPAGTLYSVFTATTPTPATPGPGVVATTSNTYNTSLSTSGLVANTTYFFQVLATNQNGIPSAYLTAAATATLSNAPGAGSFSGVGPAALTFSWSANGNPAGTLYSVLTSTASNPSAPGGAVVTTSNTYNTSLSTSGLSANTTYFFQVRAISNENVATAFSSVIGTSTLANLPGSVSYNNDTSSLIALSWSANGNPSGTLYTVFVASSPDIAVTAPGVVATSSNTYNTSLSTSGLTANSTYYFRVMATNNDGISTSYIAAPALATLANLPIGISFSGLGPANMTVSWSANGNPSGSTLYSVLASTAADPSAPNGAVVTTSNTYNTSLSTAGLSANTTYYVQVEAINVANTPTGFTVATGTSTLSNAPSGGLFSAIDLSALTFSWSANGNPAGTLYSVLTSTASNPSAPGGAVVTTSNTYNTSLSTSGLVANTTYFFQVQAINGDNVASAFTAAAGTATLAAIPNSFVFSGVGASGVTVSWSANGNPAGTLYSVFTATTPAPATPGPGVVATTSNTYNTSLSTSGLVANTTYFFQVLATNQNGIPSAYLTAAATATLSNAPTAGSFSGVGPAALTFSWSANGNPAGTLYSVLTSTASNPSAPGGAVVTTSNTYNTSLSTSGLVANTTYFFQVQAIGDGNSSTAFTLAVGTSTLANLPGTTSYGGVTASAITFSWLPNGNPAGTLYTVFVASSPDIAVTAPGVVATSSNTYNTSLSTSGLTANSTYYFRVLATNNDGISTSNLVAGSTATLSTTPASLSFGAVGASGIAVSWSANGNPTGTLYAVLTSTAPNPSAPNGAVVTTSNTYNTSLSTSGLSANTTYYFQVQTINDGGVGSAFTTAIGTSTLANVPAFASFDLSVFDSIQMNWSANGNPMGTKFAMLVSTAPNPSAPNGAVATVSNVYSTFFSTAGLAYNTTYYFQLQAINNNNIATAYSVAVGTSSYAIKPAGIGYSGITASAITASWSGANPSGTLYTVLTSTAPDPTAPAGAVVTTSNTYNTSLSTTGLLANTTYYVAWQAVNNNNVPTGYLVFFGTSTLANSPNTTSIGSVGTSSMTFSWSANDNPAGTLYSVLTSTAPNPSSPAGAAVTTSNTYSTSLSATGLSPNTTYYFQVEAISNDDVATAYTTAVGSSTLGGAPGGLAFSALGPSNITLSWSANGNPAGTLYSVLTSTAPNPTAPSGAVVTTSNTYNTSLSTGGLAANTTYYFQVQAINGDGVGGAFTAVQATSTLANAPSSASIGSVATSSITFAWSANGNPAGTLYLVLTSTAPNPSAPAGAVVTASDTYSTALSTAGLAANTTYFFQVQAIANAGAATAFTATVATATLSNALTGAYFSGIGANGITFSWSANGNPAGTLYAVLTSTAPNPAAPAGAVVTTSDTYNTSLSTAGLAANTTYFFEVRTIGNGGTPSAFTAVAATSTLADSPSGALIGAVGASTISLSWTANGDPAGTLYSVLTSTAPNPTAPAGAVVTTSNTYNTSLSAAGLAANTTYYFQVRALNNNGIPSAFTAVASTSTLANAPTAAAFSAVATTSITFSWSANGDPTGTLYNVLASTAPNPTAPAGAVVTASNTYNTWLSASGLSVNTTYFFTVQAVGNNGLPTALTAAIATATLANPPASPAFGSVWVASMTVSWSANGNPAGTVYTADLWATGYPTHTVTTTASNALFTGLFEGTTYFFQVQAQNWDGVLTAPAALLTTQSVDLSSVTALSMSGTVVSSTTVRWYWSIAGGPPDNFKLYTATGGLVAQLSGNATYYMETGLNTGAVYSRYLRAWNRLSTVFSSTVTVGTPVSQSFAVGFSSSVLLGSDAKKELDIPAANQGADVQWLLSEDPINHPLINNAPTLIAAAHAALDPTLGGSANSLTEYIVSVGGSRFTGTLAAPLTVKVPYADADNDGIVDGTSPPVRADSLQLYVLNETTSKWEVVPGSHVDLTNHVVVGQISHLSIFNAFGVGAAADLGHVRVYPIPFKPNSGNPNEGSPYSAGDPNSGIIFDNLPAQVSIKIYTITGRLVASFSSCNSTGKLRWDARNDNGQDAASGGYLAVIASPGQTTIVKKILIIR